MTSNAATLQRFDLGSRSAVPFHVGNPGPNSAKRTSACDISDRLVTRALAGGKLSHHYVREELNRFSVSALKGNSEVVGRTRKSSRHRSTTIK